MQYGASLYDTKNKGECTVYTRPNTKCSSKELLLDTERWKIEGDHVYCDSDSSDLL